eukprot:TRINITY_DN5357_c0_g1_i1.p2 TRINITY_DN5357_c0_g1~~TRINITY_DN5357_c0_g1_i1.p2  ORF type:complete len:578 (-),score=183.77 TRINITY_DN5357_c0_g1_i1:70-1803(-)
MSTILKRLSRGKSIADSYKNSPFFKRFRGEDESIDRGTGYALANAIRPTRDGTLFEHFLVVGLPTDTVSRARPNRPEKCQPQVLFQYPPNEEKPLKHDFVANFCFPRGIEVVCHERTKSASDQLELMFGQFSKVEGTDSSFIFLISGEENILYGVCVLQPELITDYSSFVAAPPTLTSRGVCDFFAPRCYCFLSRFPFFSVHFEVLYSILARNRLRRISLAVGVQDEEKKGESEIDLVKAYYQKEVPTESNGLKFNLPGELRSLEFVCPPGDEDRQMAEWGLVTLFKLLSLKNIMTLFTCVMLEKSIIFFSHDVGLLSACTLSIIPLLRPYVFQGPFIPVLPEEFLEFLESPVPYVIGATHLPEDLIREDKVIVDIDNDTITLPTTEISKLPEQKKLMSSLEPYHEAIAEKVQKANPYKNMPKNHEFVIGISAAFRSYQCWVMDEVIIRHLDGVAPSSDPGNAGKSPENSPEETSEHPASGSENAAAKKFDFTDPVQVENLISQMPKDYRNFMSEFLKSQLFISYAEKLLDAIRKKILHRAPHLRTHQRSRSTEVIDSFMKVFRDMSIATNGSGSPT